MDGTRLFANCGYFKPLIAVCPRQSGALFRDPRPATFDAERMFVFPAYPSEIGQAASGRVIVEATAQRVTGFRAPQSELNGWDWGDSRPTACSVRGCDRERDELGGNRILRWRTSRGMINFDTDPRIEEVARDFRSFLQATTDPL